MNPAKWKTWITFRNVTGKYFGNNMGSNMGNNMGPNMGNNMGSYTEPL